MLPKPIERPNPLKWKPPFTGTFTQKRFRPNRKKLTAAYLAAKVPLRPDIAITGRAGLPQREGDIARHFRIFPFPIIIPAGLTVLEDFEDGDLSAYSGNVGLFNVHVEGAQEGNFGLVTNPAGGPGNIYRTDLTTQQGKTYKWWFRLSDEKWSMPNSFGFLFGLQGAGNYYQAFWIKDSEEMRLVRVIAGAPTTLGSAVMSVTYQTWYQFQLAWATGGGMTLDWSGGAEQATGSDNTWASGGFGWSHGGDAMTGSGLSDYLTEE